MRFREWSAGLVLTLGMLACTPRAERTADSAQSLEVDTAAVTPGKPERRWVTVHIGCNKDNFTAQISPWTRKLVENDTLEWRVSGTGYQLDSVRIRPRNGGAWPLDSGPPYKATPGNPARGGKARSSFGKGPFNYEIEFWCKSGSDSLYGIIDPDIIIVDAM